MSPDAQLPRWEVFKQDDPGKPHAAVGSVHAADPQHALHMARTVFARRPSAHSMWLAPSWAVHQFSREQLAQPPAPASPSAAATRYLVFLKASDRRSMVACEHWGEVTAAGQAAALAMVEAAQAPLGVWLVEADAVIATDPADADSWFGPALDKRYRQQSEYAVRVGRRTGKEPAP